MNLISAKTHIERDHEGRILRDAVEYSVVQHCNLRCKGCDHAAPHLPKHFAQPNAFAADMAALSRHLHVRILRLLGGEPLLHRQLDAFVEAARDIGIADQIMLWTNGILLHTIDRDVLRRFDIVRVSLYPGVNLRADLAELACDLEQNGRTRLEIARVEKFFHQLVNEPVREESLVRRTYARCKETHLWSCHTVHDGHYYKCTKAPTLAARLANCGIEIANRVHDGVVLHNNPLLREDLERYLLSRDPLLACKWCLGTDGKSFPHRQLDEAGLRIEQRTDGSNPDHLRAGPIKQLLRDVRQSVGC